MSNSNTDAAPKKRGRPPKAKNLVIDDTVSFSSSGESSGRHHKTPVVATVVENSSNNKKRTASPPPKHEPGALNTSKWLLRTLGGGGLEKKPKTMEPVPDTQFSQDDGEEEEEMKFTLPVLPNHPLLSPSSMTMATPPPKVARVTSSKITGLVCTKVWLTDVITVTSSLASETHSAYIDNTAPLVDSGGGGGGGGKPRELWQMAWDATVTKRRGPYGDGLVLHQAHFRVRQHLHDESGGNKAFDFAPTFIVLQNVVTKHEFLLDSKFFGSWISV